MIRALCQIERCCPECEGDEEAVEIGFGMVCGGSIPTEETRPEGMPGIDSCS